jgi:hypothetical protein
MNTLKWTLLLLFLAGTCPAGLLDSIIAPPRLLSLERAQNIRGYFLDNADDICSFPGSVLYFNSDTTCFSPTLWYIDGYDNTVSSASDSETTNMVPDSLQEYRFRMAMTTFRRFGPPRKKNPKVYHFTHATYLKYLEEKEEIRKMPFLYRILMRFLEFINKFILQPLYRLIITPFEKLPFFWKTVLFTAAVAVFIVVVVVLGRFAARIYPVTDRSAAALNTGGGKESSEEKNWLQMARGHYNNRQPAVAVECLYRYLITWFLNRNKVQRYEWWTNRQFLAILQTRFGGDVPIAEKIISTYEQVVYGHYPAELQRVEALIEMAERLRGRGGQQK